MTKPNAAEAETAAHRTEAFNITQLIEEIVSMHRGEASKKGIELQYELMGSVDSLWIGAPVVARQILIQIVSNTIQRGSNGTIKLALQFASHQSIQATFIVSAVNDSSPQLHDALEALDLSRADQDAKKIGGSLMLQQSATANNRILLCLPFEIGDPIDPTQTARKLAVRKLLKDRQVLVADDLDFNRYINAEVLSRMGAQVEMAIDGHESLQQLKTKHYDLALLDIDMPGLSGIDVVQRYQQTHPKKHTEFIALSAHATTDMEQACLDAGFKHFIHKPLTQQKITAYLSNTSTQATAKADTSLLEYLAQNSSANLDRLQARYKSSFSKELKALQAHRDAQDQEAQRRSVHKLSGLASLQQDHAVIELLETLSTQLKASEPTESIDALINQLGSLDSAS